MRVIALDVHRSFAEVAVLENGRVCSGGRVVLEHDRVVAFGRTLRADDEVVLEATGNTLVIARLLAPFVRRVVIANPLQTRAIAHARVKTDKIDARVLAELHASGFLPEVWLPDEATETLRRRVAQRAQVVAQMTRLKNRVRGILHANLIPPYEGELLSEGGRAWLMRLPISADQVGAIRRHLDELERLARDLVDLDAGLARHAMGDERVRRLMTINGVDATVAVAVVAAVGDIARFGSPQRLVSYFGLNPSVRQSGDRPARHGRITKQGRSHARAMLVEAAWAAVKAPGPLRGFFLRVKDRRGQQVAAVATARKLAVLIWHLLAKEEEYAWARPALVAMKRRRLELAAGLPPRRGGKQPGPARDYSIKAIRDRERAWLEQAEDAYKRFVSAWQRTPPPGERRAGASRATP